jgi:hypothetical protein
LAQRLLILRLIRNVDRLLPDYRVPYTKVTQSPLREGTSETSAISVGVTGNITVV